MPELRRILVYGQLYFIYIFRTSCFVDLMACTVQFNFVTDSECIIMYISEVSLKLGTDIRELVCFILSRSVPFVCPSEKFGVNCVTESVSVSTLLNFYTVSCLMSSVCVCSLCSIVVSRIIDGSS